MKKLENKIALITGCSTGMGQATALTFANEGAKVLITGRNEDTLKISANQHENISYLVADVGIPSDAIKTIKHVEQSYGGLDILINNAGVALFAPLEATSLEEHFDVMFNINGSSIYSVMKNMPI